MKQPVWASRLERFRSLPLLTKIHLVLKRIPFQPVEVSRFFVLSLDAFPERFASRRVGGLRLATKEDIPKLCLLQNKPEVFAGWLDRGEHCVVALAGDEIVGFNWFSSAEFYIEDLSGFRLAIPSDTIYAFDAFLKENYRLRGKWVQFLIFMKQWMDTAGKTRMITMVDFGNDPALKPLFRFGFKVTQDVLGLAVLGRRWFWRRSVGQQVHWKDFLIG